MSEESRDRGLLRPDEDTLAVARCGIQDDPRPVLFEILRTEVNPLIVETRRVFAESNRRRFESHQPEGEGQAEEFLFVRVPHEDVQRLQ